MAGNIDQLNFEVIISDEKFDEQIKAVEAKARQFNTSMSNILNIRRISTQMSQQEVANSRRVLQAKVDEERAQERINREKIRTEGLQRKINAQIERATKGYQSQGSILNELKGIALGYLSVHGADQLLSSLIRVTGEFEMQKTTLAAMLGDMNAAEQVITRIQGLAVESPFQFKELTTYAKQLSAFSVPAEELYDTTKMLADVSAGLGVGMDRIVLAYGQVRSAAFLRGQEVRQFTEAGIPILDELAKQFSELEGRAVSTGEVFDKISARLVPFEMVAKVFKDMTSEGGKFYNMQEVQAETLQGKISNLKDAYEVMLNEIGKGQSENLKGAVDWVRGLMQNYEQTGRTLVELVAAYGVYKTALMALTAATGTFSLANHKLLSTFVSLGASIAGNPYVLLAAGITAVGYAIYKSATSLESYEKVQKSVADTHADFNKSVIVETSKLDTLYAKLKLAKEGTEEYADAKKAIYTQYASYISDIKNEGIAVEDLAGIYDNLKTKIEESQKARFRNVASQNIEQVYQDEADAILGEAGNATNRLLKKTAFQLNEHEKLAIQAYVGGVMSMEDIKSDQSLAKVATLLTQGAESGNRAWMQFATSIETAREQFLKSTQAYKDGLDAIDKIYGKAQDTATTGANPFVYNLDGGGGSDKSPAQKAIEEQIKSVQKLQDAYEKLMPYLSDKDMKVTLKNLFPNAEDEIIDSLDFTAALEKLASQLETFDPDAANRLRDTLGKDAASEMADTFKKTTKAAKEYYDALRKWEAEDFNLNGEGITLDVSKIASDLEEKTAEINLRARKMRELFDQIDMDGETNVHAVKNVFVEEFGEDAWDEFWSAYQKKGADAITELADKQKGYERGLAQERVNDLAEKYVKESYFTEGIELSDFGDKTYFQIRKIRKNLQELADKEPLTIPVEIESRLEDAGVDLSDLTGVNLDTIYQTFEASGEPIDDATQGVLNLIQQIQKAGLSTKKFGYIIKKVFSGDLAKLTQEEGEALLSMVQSYVGEISDLLDSVAEYAEAIGNDELQGAMKGISEAADILSNVASKVAQGDYIGAAISWVTSLASTILDAASATAELNNRIREAQTEARVLASENAINEGVEPVWGTDDYRKFTNAYDEAVKAHKKATEDIARQNEKMSGGSADDWGAGGMAGAIGIGAGLGAAVGSIIPGIGTAVGAALGALVGMVTAVVGQASTEANNYALTLQEMADSIGMELIDAETGIFNVETLEKIKETYSDLDSEYIALIDDMIATAEIYENAVAEMTTYMSDMFDACAEDMAASFIEAFKESGQATLEYGDIMDEVATNIAQSVIKSVLLQNVFSDEMTKEAALKLASGDTAGAMAVVEQAMKAAQDLTPYMQEFLESMEPYFQMEDETSTSELGEGIKGITEDQANLLASYLNAIRADVSYSKTLWVRMDGNLQRIAEMLTAPTYMEYQAQIAANTANNATYAQSIMEDLRSVLTNDSGATSIRVYREN